MIAASHPRQADRLAALRRLEVLDTPREAEFDEVVSLAAQICDAPISVVNLIDAERQWFKAEVGLGVRETPLETSLCSHVILEKDFVEIPDTLRDQRMSDNPLCLAADNPLRFYAGALLTTEEGLPIGTLCVLDHEPRRLSDLQKETVRVLARQVMRQLELRLAIRREHTLRNEIDHRVKNSLSMVAAMIRMQTRVVTSEEARAALMATGSRVEAIAALHREMYEGAAFDRINLDQYMNRIERLLAESAPPGVSLSFEFDRITVDSGAASALAMIVNEFVANAFKYAFPDDRPGAVTVTGKRRPDGTLIVTASDDGVGSAAAPSADTFSVGTTIMTASASKLGAELDFELTEGGARLALEILPSALRTRQ